MKEKTKTNWEHFYNNVFIINEEIYVAQKQVYWGVMQGKERRWSATIYSNLQKKTQSRLTREYTGKIYNDRKHLYSFYVLDWRHTLRHTHSDKINPVEGKGLLQSGREAG